MEATGQFSSYQARVGFQFVRKELDVNAEEFYVDAWATSDDVDFEFDVFDRSAMEGMAKGLLLSPTVFYNHNYGAPVGRVVEAAVEKNERGGWGVKIKVFVSKQAAEIRQFIADGTLSGFSVGGRLLEVVSEFNEEAGRTIRRILDFLIYEVSVVGIPCNRRARAIEWYTKMYRMAAEKAGELSEFKSLKDLGIVAHEQDSYVAKGTPPELSSNFFGEAATTKEAEAMTDETTSSTANPHKLRSIASYSTAAELKEALSVRCSKSVDLHDMDMRTFMNNIWAASVEAAEETGIFGPIDRDWWYPLYLETVFDGDVVVYNPENDKYYKANYATADGVAFTFENSIEVRPRLVYDEVKALGDDYVDVALYLRRALPEHETPISDEEDWDSSDVVDDLRKWASSDGSGDVDVIDWDTFALAFSWYELAVDDDDEESDKSVFLLLHHQVEDSALTLNQIGLDKAVKMLLDSDDNLGIPDDELEEVQRHLVSHLRQIDPDADNPFEEDTTVEEQDGNVTVDAPAEDASSEGDDKGLKTNKDAEPPVEDEPEVAEEPEAEPEAEPDVEDEPEADEEPAVGDEPENEPEADTPEGDEEPEATDDGEPEPEPEVEESVVDEEPEVEAAPVVDEEPAVDSEAQFGIIEELGKLLKLESPDVRRMAGLLGQLQRGTPAETVEILDEEEAIHNLRALCSSDSSGSKKSMDWRKFKGFFGHFEGEVKSLASYSNPLYDVIDDSPVVSRKAVEDTVVAYKSNELKLSESDKARVQRAFKMFSDGNPFAMSTEEAAQKQVAEQLGEVKNLVKELQGRVDGLGTELKAFKEGDEDSGALADRVKNLEDSLREARQHLAKMVKASGMSQQIPIVDEDVAEEPEETNKGFTGIFGPKFAGLKQKIENEKANSGE